MPRQSSVTDSLSKNGQTPKGTLHSRRLKKFLEEILLAIVGQLKWQRSQGFHEQQQELFKIMASVVMAWTLEEKRSGKISANQPESGRLEEDAEVAEQKSPRQQPEPLPPRQSLAARPLALLSSPEVIGGDEHKVVMVSEIMVEIGDGV